MEHDLAHHGPPPLVYGLRSRGGCRNCYVGRGDGAAGILEVAMKREHDWLSTRALPDYGEAMCRRKGCTAKSVMRNWKWRQVSGPKECGGTET